jgi:Zn finger protein HypA/HybF involved in hydrogenase expression
MDLREQLDKHNLQHITVESFDGEMVRCFCEIHKLSFTAKNRNLIRSKGCKKCSKSSYKQNKRIPLDKLEQKLHSVHNNKYKYPNLSIRVKNKIEILCPKHGAFWQNIYSHKNGIGCPKCGAEKVSKAAKYSDSKWIEEFRKVHKDTYNYDTPLVRKGNKIKITCKQHGDFYQLPAVHNIGHGCPKCSAENTGKRSQKTQEECIRDFVKKHGNKYDYSSVVYENAKKKVEIICRKHGSFFQTPNDHLTGYGCPKCYVKSSKKEEEILKLLRSNGIKCKKSDRTVLNGKEIDILIPDMKLGIEFNGTFWHSFDTMDFHKYHLEKTELANSKQIDLIHIFEDDWDKRKNACLSYIKHRVGLCDNKVFARKCSVSKITTKEYKDFCDSYHIQGSRNSSIRFVSMTVSLWRLWDSPNIRSMNMNLYDSV